MNEFGSNEDMLMISSVVQKSKTCIAHPVSLRVQPLTITEALAGGLDIPTVEGNVNISDNTSEIRRRIPIRAKCKSEVYIHCYQVVILCHQGC